MKKILVLILSLLLFALIFSACSDIANITLPQDNTSSEIARGDNTIIWTGKGIDSLASECGEEGYIHWTLNQAKGVTSAGLVLDGSGLGSYPPVEITKGGVYYFTTSYFDLETLVAYVTYVGDIKKNTSLVIAEYCPGDGGDPPTTQYALTVNIVGNGSVEVDNILYTGSVTVDEGTVLDLEAIADSGWQFDSWTGDLVSTNTTESITIDANKTVTANFEELPPAYTPDDCFTFDSSTGTITDYTCAGGDVSIPPSIGGTAVLAIGNQVFYMKNLTGILIPEGVTSIGSGAFVANVLHSVTIPDSVTYIGSEAFSSIQLQSLTIGSGLTSIPYAGFGYNDLTSVTIPDNVTSIGQYAFVYNELTSVNIGSGVTSIGYLAFSGPQNLITQITIGANVTIDGDLNTMGANHGFKDVYDAGGKLAGTYNYIGGVWVKE